MIDELRKVDPQLPAWMKAMAGYTASRTKFFDEFFIAAGAAGISQVVILAAGLDARAWRLPWIDGTVVFEIDQPRVLAFKGATLHAAGTPPPAARYVAVPVDLCLDWPAALLASQDLLFDRVQQLSAPGSRVAVESFAPEFFDPQRLARRREQLRAVREAAAKTGNPDVPDTETLWFLEDRADVEDWLRTRGWDVTTTRVADLMARYHRPAPDDVEDPTLESVLVEGRLR